MIGWGLGLLGIIVSILIALGYFPKFQGENQQLLEEIRKSNKEIREYIKRIGAESFSNDPDKTEKAIENFRKNPQTALLGEAIKEAFKFQQQEKFKEAINKWSDIASSAAEASDNNLAARSRLSVGFLLEKQGKLQDAIAAYNEVLHLKPDYATAYFNRGNAKNKLKKFLPAIADFNEALRFKSDYAAAYNNRGTAKISLGQHKAAIADFNEAIRLKPDHVGAYNNRGHAKSDLGQHDAAIADYNEAIRLNPNLGKTYNNRGTAKSNLGRQKAAIKDYNEAIRLNPNLAQPYYNRGNAKFKLSQYTAAIIDYDEAIRLNQHYTKAYNNRGLAKAKLGRKVEARKDFEKARDLARLAGNESLAGRAVQELKKLDEE